MNVQLCQMKGRGKCGRVARQWFRCEWQGWGGATQSVVKAACDKCIEDRGAGRGEIIEAIDQPILRREAVTA